MSNDDLNAGTGLVGFAPVTERLDQLTYAPLPWQTHPIDTNTGSQGWGPMAGPYTPYNFDAAKDTQSGGSGINITWFQGDNESTVAQPPNYAVLTLMADKSLSFVNNQGFVGTMLSQPQQNGSTIGQASNVQTTGLAQTTAGATGFWQSLKQLMNSGG